MWNNANLINISFTLSCNDNLSKLSNNYLQTTFAQFLNILLSLYKNRIINIISDFNLLIIVAICDGKINFGAQVIELSNIKE